MPSIDYRAVRSLMSIEQVLGLIGFAAIERSGDEIRGKCPLHESKSTVSRSYSANLRKNAFRCFSCGASGNQLDLWAMFTKCELHSATINLCDRLKIDMPAPLRSNSKTEKRRP